MLKTLQNFFKTEVSVAWAAGTGNRYITTLPTPSSGTLVVNPSSLSKREIVNYSAKGTDSGGNYITLSTRGVGGTTDQIHAVGESVRMNITAEMYSDIQTELDLKLDDTQLDTDGTLAANSDTKIATQKATKTYAMPLSYLDTTTTLGASDVKVPSQNAVKVYVDGVAIAGSPNASETVKGIVEEATLAQTIAGDSTGETGAKLFVTPEKLVDALPTLVPTVYPYTIFNQMTGSSAEFVYNQYSDSTQFAVATQSSTTVFYANSTVAGGPQSRDVTSDWASATFIASSVTLGAYLYLFLRDGSSNYRVYRYAVGSLSSGGTLMTISGQSFSTTGGSVVVMTSNGTNFYFNYKGGNSANDRVISKYTLSGTTLTYSSDITCGASNNVTNRLVYVDASENIYGIYPNIDLAGDNRVRKYNSSGTLQYTTIAFPTSQSFRAVFTFGTANYLEYSVPTNPWFYLVKVFI